MDGINTLRANIGILTRGGPFQINTYQHTKPVLLAGMPLPAEAEFSFPFPFNRTKNYVNHAVTVELFFGDNDREVSDISLGEYSLKDLTSGYADSEWVELMLAVDRAQMLCLSIRVRSTDTYRSICFVDISHLTPPEVQAVPRSEAGLSGKKLYDDISQMLLNPQPRTAGHPKRGKDLFYEVKLSFLEALIGGQEVVEVPLTLCKKCGGSGLPPGKSETACPVCQGTGWKREETGKEIKVVTCPACDGNGLVNAEPCPDCGGKGWTDQPQKMVLSIPARIDSGAQICLLHQGVPGKYGGPAGHVRVTALVALHPLFERTGRDVTVRVPISDPFHQTGGQLRIPGPLEGSQFLVDLPARADPNRAYPVAESANLRLAVRIEPYRPAFLFAAPDKKERLRQLQALLGDAAMECSGAAQMGAPAAFAELPVEQRKQQAVFYARRGDLYAEQGDLAFAQADFDRAIRLDAGCAAAYDGRSILYLKQKQPEKALADLDQAIALDRKNPLFRFHRGLFYDVQQDPPMAIIDYTDAIALDPRNPDFYTSRGRAENLLRDPQSALADYSRALELDPSNAEAYRTRGVLYYNLQDLDRALSDLDQAVRLRPDHLAWRSERAQILVKRGEFERALTELDAILSINAGLAEAYNNRGYVLLQLGRLDQALHDYDRALELDPTLAAALVYRARIHLQKDTPVQAVHDLQKALKITPNDLYALLTSGEAYQAAGEKKLARDAYQTVLNASQNAQMKAAAHQHLEGLDGKLA